MLIGVQGINGNNNGAVGIASSIAGFLALNHNRKTLILQFLNNSADNAENSLLGNQRRIEICSDEDVQDGDEGMDYLFNRVEGSKLMDKDFTNACIPIIEKINHLFDVASITIDSKLDSTLLAKMEENEDNIVSRLIKSAAGDSDSEEIGIYSNIIFIIEPSNEEFAKKMNEFTDYTVYCVPQGFALANVKITDKKKEIIVVNDFDMDSKFNIKTMKKEYSVKKIYPVVHNVGYKDALLAGTLASFIKRNRECTKEDKNYWWYQSITDIVTFVSGKEKEQERLSTKSLEKEEVVKELHEFNQENCEVVEEESKKKRLFGSKPKRKLIGKKKKNVPSKESEVNTNSEIEESRKDTEE